MPSYSNSPKIHVHLLIAFTYLYQKCLSFPPPITKAQIISDKPLIVSLPNLIQPNEIKFIDNIIKNSDLTSTNDYQEDVFSTTIYEQEDELFEIIIKPFEDRIPEDEYSPMKKFVYVVTKFQNEMEEQDIIQGAYAIQRRKARERWMSDEGKEILKLSGDDDTSFKSIGKRYNMSTELKAHLEKNLVAAIVKGSWILKDATIVYYKNGDSQVPHLDPCDATILVCLENTSDDGNSSGDTCFPLLDIRIENIKGNGILFFSSDLENRERNTMSLHHGGVVNGEKVIFQLMLDYDGDIDFNSWLDTVAGQ